MGYYPCLQSQKFKEQTVLINSYLPLVVTAGVLNGFYVFPIKKNSDKNNLLWVLFALLTFIVIPTIFLGIKLIDGSMFLPTNALLTMIVVGLVYGIGTSFVAKAMELIGIGIPFGLSLSVGTFSGSLFSLVLAKKLVISKYMVLAYSLFIIAVLLIVFATYLRDKSHSANNFWLKGIMFACIGSILQATQGACLSYFGNSIKELGYGFTAQFIPWALIYIPCGLMFAFLKLRAIKKEQTPLVYFYDKKLWLYAAAMSVLNISAVVLYAVSIFKTKIFSEEYLWAAFMGGIVFGSSCCSYLKKEWALATPLTNVLNILALVSMSLSFIALVYVS